MDNEQINNGMLKDCDSLKVSMEIEITKIVGFNGKGVPVEKWNEFGVMQ